MTTPKPAPSKPLTFTPPQYLKGETQSSELPLVEGAEPNVISKKAPQSKNAKKRRGLRPNIVMVDEAVEGLNLPTGEEGQKAIFDFSTKESKVEKPKKPFVLDPHLTQRPFHDDRLMQLKSRLQRPSFKNR